MVTGKKQNSAPPPPPMLMELIDQFECFVFENVECNWQVVEQNSALFVFNPCLMTSAFIKPCFIFVLRCLLLSFY